jgi:hypothetical protein
MPEKPTTLGESNDVPLAKLSRDETYLAMPTDEGKRPTSSETSPGQDPIFPVVLIVFAVLMVSAGIVTLSAWWLRRPAQGALCSLLDDSSISS